jgi:hypothetical protein
MRLIPKETQCMLSRNGRSLRSYACGQSLRSYARPTSGEVPGHKGRDRRRCVCRVIQALIPVGSCKFAWNSSMPCPASASGSASCLSRISSFPADHTNDPGERDRIQPTDTHLVHLGPHHLPLFGTLFALFNLLLLHYLRSHWRQWFLGLSCGLCSSFGLL